MRRADAPARRLEELNEQRTSQVARLKLVERDREALEGGKAEAEAFIEKETKLARSRCTLFQLFLGEALGNVAKIEANKGELEAKLAHERCVAPLRRFENRSCDVAFQLRGSILTRISLLRCAARSMLSTRPRCRRRRRRTVLPPQSTRR